MNALISLSCERKPIACRFYGRSHVAFNAMDVYLDTGGNECALIATSFSPCYQERRGRDPVECFCPVAQYRALVEKVSVAIWQGRSDA